MSSSRNASLQTHCTASLVRHRRRSGVDMIARKACDHICNMLRPSHILRVSRNCIGVSLVTRACTELSSWGFVHGLVSYLRRGSSCAHAGVMCVHLGMPAVSVLLLANHLELLMIVHRGLYACKLTCGSAGRWLQMSNWARSTGRCTLSCAVQPQRPCLHSLTRRMRARLRWVSLPSPSTPIATAIETIASTACVDSDQQPSAWAIHLSVNEILLQ